MYALGRSVDLHSAVLIIQLGLTPSASAALVMMASTSAAVYVSAGSWSLDLLEGGEYGHRGQGGQRGRGQVQ